MRYEIRVLLTLMALQLKKSLGARMQALELDGTHIASCRNVVSIKRTASARIVVFLASFVI